MKRTCGPTIDALVKSIERKSKQAAKRGIRVELSDQIKIGLATGMADKAIELSQEAVGEGRLEDGAALYDGAMTSLEDADAKLSELLKTKKRSS